MRRGAVGCARIIPINPWLEYVQRDLLLSPVRRALTGRSIMLSNAIILRSESTRTQSPADSTSLDFRNAESRILSPDTDRL